MAQGLIVRPWHKRRDRSAIAHWPASNIPAHWSYTKSDYSDSQSWAVDQHNVLVGRITLRDVFDKSGVMGIYLHPHYYGKGIGSTAIPLFLAICPVDTITIECAADNQRAIRLYAKCGFSAVEMRKECINNCQFYMVQMKWNRCTL